MKPILRYGWAWIAWRVRFRASCDALHISKDGYRTRTLYDAERVERLLQFQRSGQKDWQVQAEADAVDDGEDKYSRAFS